MLEIYRTIGGSIEAIDEICDGCWINMVRPTTEELQRVTKGLEAEEDFIRAALDPEESSRVEKEDNHILMIVDIPTIENAAGGQQFGTLPMGIIVTERAVVTVCLVDTVVLRSIAENAVKDVRTEMKTRFVFQILMRVAGRFLKNLRLIEHDFTAIESRLYGSMKNQELIQLLGYSKSLVYFSASLKGNEVTMEKVLRGRILKLYEDDRDLLEDALIEIRQAIEMASIYSSILSGTMDAYASVVSNNLNIIMKVLTVITIIMTIPNIIFGFFGMNIGNGQIPLAGAWWMPVVVAGIGCIIAWIFLNRRDLM